MVVANNIFPIIIIMQGPSGAGKSYHAARFAEEQSAIICSADDFPGLYSRRPDGTVSIDVSKLGAAHGWCLRKCIERLQAGRSAIVDNTNTTPIEVAPYMALAQAFDAAPWLVRVECDPDIAHARNSHGVPREVFDGQVARLDAFEEPPYWRFIPGYRRLTVDGGAA